MNIRRSGTALVGLLVLGIAGSFGLQEISRRRELQPATVSFSQGIFRVTSPIPIGVGARMQEIRGKDRRWIGTLQYCGDGTDVSFSLTPDLKAQSFRYNSISNNTQHFSGTGDMPLQPDLFEIVSKSTLPGSVEILPSKELWAQTWMAQNQAGSNTEYLMYLQTRPSSLPIDQQEWLKSQRRLSARVVYAPACLGALALVTWVIVAAASGRFRRTRSGRGFEVEQHVRLERNGVSTNPCGVAQFSWFNQRAVMY